MADLDVRDDSSYTFNPLGRLKARVLKLES
jgi:hypothetical protein